MKSSTLAGLLVALGTLGAQSQAHAISREQVRMELADAIRSGDVATGESSLSRRELFPQRYPAPAAAAMGKTRAQVQAELAEAIRTGDLVANGETGLKLNQLQPSLYAGSCAVPEGTQHAASSSGSTLR